MTNQEIIDEVSGNDVIYIETEVIKFMDAAREDEAVGFLTWVEQNCEDKLKNYDFRELYQLYKQKQ